METFVVKNREEARALTLSMIPEGSVCASGGSVTLKECGVIDAIKEGTISEDRINNSLKRVFRIKYADSVGDE